MPSTNYYSLYKYTNEIHSSSLLPDLFKLEEISRIESKTKMSSLIKGFKTLSFLVLLIIVTLQYALDIYGKFINDSKAFVSKTVDADSFTMPPITICMDNALKPTVLKKVAGHFNSKFMIEKYKVEKSVVKACS